MHVSIVSFISAERCYQFLFCCERDSIFSYQLYSSYPDIYRNLQLCGVSVLSVLDDQPPSSLLPLPPRLTVTNISISSSSSSGLLKTAHHPASTRLTAAAARTCTENSSDSRESRRIHHSPLSIAPQPQHSQSSSTKRQAVKVDSDYHSKCSTI